MERFSAILRISLLEGVLDPQAKAVEHLIRDPRGTFGFTDVVPSSLKMAKEFEVVFGAEDEETARNLMEKLLREGGLHNPNMEKGLLVNLEKIQSPA